MVRSRRKEISSIFCTLIVCPRQILISKYLYVKGCTKKEAENKVKLALEKTINTEDGSIKKRWALFYPEKEPGDLNIYSYGLALKWKKTVLDRLIITVFSPKTKSKYKNWKKSNPGFPKWIKKLPPVYSSLSRGHSDPEHPPGGGKCPNDEWKGVNNRPASNNYHYVAEWEMRSKTTSNGHRHQACYLKNDKLIEANLNSEPHRLASAGTVDKKGGVLAHVAADVEPFIRAAQLDGNPVEPEALASRISQPLIIVGNALKAYYKRRPPHTSPQVSEGACILP